MAKTWGTLKAEILNELDLQGEDWATPGELLTFANEANSIVDKEIVGLNDKYFETEGTLSVTAGNAFLDLPSDIQATKITGIYDSDGREICFIKEKKDLFNRDSSDYGYRMDNSLALGSKIKVYPTPSNDANWTIFYIRQGAELIDDASIVTPLGLGFIKQYVREKVQHIEMGPMAQFTPGPALVRERDLMLEALSQMIPDDTTSELQGDFSHYEDSYLGSY